MFWGEEAEAITYGPHRHRGSQLIGPLQRELPMLLLGPLLHQTLDVYIQPKTMAVIGPRQWSNTFQHMEHSMSYILHISLEWEL